MSFIAISSVSSSGMDSAEIAVVALELDADSLMSDFVLGGTCVLFPRLQPIIIKMSKEEDDPEIYI